MDSDQNINNENLAEQLQRLLMSIEASGRAILPRSNDILLKSIVEAAGRIFGAAAASLLLVVCWLNNARNSLPGLAARGRVGHLPKMGDEPCVVESRRNFS